MDDELKGGSGGRRKSSQGEKLRKGCQAVPDGSVESAQYYTDESFYAGSEYEQEEPCVAQKTEAASTDACWEGLDENFYDGAASGCPATVFSPRQRNGSGEEHGGDERDFQPVVEETKGKKKWFAKGKRRGGKEADRRHLSQNSIEMVNKKAGRNLPAAILVGCVLIVFVLAGLFVWQPLLLLLAMTFTFLSAWELYKAFSSKGNDFPIVPVLVSIASMLTVTYLIGARGLFIVLGLSTIAFVVWTSLDTVVKPRTISVGILTILWIGFLPSFIFLVYGQHVDADDGRWRALLIVLTVVVNDTCAYASGLLWGKHLMAPKISPKKSWEGFIGGIAGTMIFATLYVHFILQVPLIFGIIFGILMAVAATSGDLVESLVKRGLEVKDMSDLLPGHGGILDRLDSLLLCIPTGWALFTFVLPLLR